MRIVVLGTGYVGLVTGTCFAETGHEVTCVDSDDSKIDALRGGWLPIYEPGLDELVRRNREAGRLDFSTDPAAPVTLADVVFLAVGTPPRDDGSVDLASLWAVVDAIAPHLRPTAVVVCKSTVPVGTNAAIAARLKEITGRDCDVASNPEFLKEGTAIGDFMRPDRVVVGARRAAVVDVLRDLYQPYLRTERPLLAMSPESAELTKYAANALLAARISFINEIATICEAVGADVTEVRRGIGHDSRIGLAFLFPGAGYGGSCFPKDIRALVATAAQYGIEARLSAAIEAVNERQKTVLARKIQQHFGGALAGRTIAIWGLAFKPGTDDIRDAPSRILIDRLLESDAALRVHDPVAMDNIRRVYGERLTYCPRRDDALEGADALAIVTEWKEFTQPDFAVMRRRMRAPIVFDGRNLYDPARMAAEGFLYYSIGRRTVDGRARQPCD